MSVLQPAKRIGKTYQNPIPTGQLAEPFVKVLWKYITAKEEREPKNQLGPFSVDTGIYNIVPATGMRITWMGHSSLIIEVDGIRLLTDPVIGRASFASFAGPKRFFPYPISLSELPPLDAVILSHDHYDHLDELAIKQLAGSAVSFICSKGVGTHLQRWGIAADRITELDWTQTTTLGNCTITATPARHFSGRGVINRNQTLWSSFVIKGPKHSVFFGADSGWFPGFKEIGDTYGPFDLTMLEVGASDPAWPDIHMGPDKATDAHLALGGKLMMPIHWGTFNLALHAWREPVESTIKYSKQKGIELFLPKPGDVTDVTGVYNSEWWK